MLYSLNVNIQQVKFDQNKQGMPKKKDRYREIFGERPKFLLVKRNTTDSDTIVGNSTNKVNSLLYPKFR